jgi:hypothetical protein
MLALVPYHLLFAISTRETVTGVWPTPNTVNVKLAVWSSREVEYPITVTVMPLPERTACTLVMIGVSFALVPAREFAVGVTSVFEPEKRMLPAVNVIVPATLPVCRRLPFLSVNVAVVELAGIVNEVLALPFPNSMEGSVAPVTALWKPTLNVPPMAVLQDDVKETEIVLEAIGCARLGNAAIVSFGPIAAAHEIGTVAGGVAESLTWAVKLYRPHVGKAQLNTPVAELIVNPDGGLTSDHW